MTKIIFLLGHRKQMGKDTSCDIIEKILNVNNISFTRTSFAKKLKKHCAERYDLDFDKMEFDEYKKSKPLHLNGMSVRDVLTKEGQFARSIWNNVWTSSTYREILDSGASIGIISDYRYPNEDECFESIFNSWQEKNKSTENKPKLIKVLAHRERGSFNSDGADDQLPDLSSFWDEVILNNIEDGSWHENIVNQVVPMVYRNLDKYANYELKGLSHGSKIY